MAKLKQSVIEKIETDPDLFALIAKALDIKPASLPVTLKRNGSSLNQYDIVKKIADYLETTPDKILEEDTVNEEEVGQK